MSLTSFKKGIHALSVIALLGEVVLSAARPLPTYAASVTSLTDTLSSVTKSATAVTHAVRFTTPTGASDSTDTITLTFATGFDISLLTLPANVSFTHGAGGDCTIVTETVDTGSNATNWLISRSGQVLTLTAPTDGVGAGPVGAGDGMCINLTGNGVTNPSTAGSYEISIGGTFGDSGTLEVSIVDDSSVAVSSTVDETLSFTLTGNSVSLGTLSASSQTTGTNTFTVATNAASGYVTTVKGATLTSGSNTITAIGSTAASSTTGTEQFGINVSASGGSGTVDSTYTGTGSQYGYGANSSTTDTVASSTVPSTTTTYTATYLANISAVTEPGSYTTTLTYVTTGTF